jgi:hypothetical protein
MATYSQDIDPAIALEILPDKILQVRRRITELALDLSVIEAVPEHSEAELVTLGTMLRVQKAALAEYETRLKAIQKAARGPAAEDDQK